MGSAPDFWRQCHHPLGLAFTPLSWIYQAENLLRRRFTTPYHAGIPVMCVGNIVAGGAGKTPVVIELVRLLKEMGRTPHVISRGYGGTLTQTTRVDGHDATQVGDEPLLLAAHAPCWIGKDRPASARAAVSAGADCLVMDDGFQNPSLHKDMSVIVIDGGYGFGNKRVIPAGALREPIASGLQRAQLAVMIGEDAHHITDTLPIPTLRATICPTIEDSLRDAPLVAFCGIGRPQKFFDTLHEHGLRLADTRPFPDHHPYVKSELLALQALATSHNASLVTTSKDWVRLDSSCQAQVTAIPIRLEWEDNTLLLNRLTQLFSE